MKWFHGDYDEEELHENFNIESAQETKIVDQVIRMQTYRYNENNSNYKLVVLNPEILMDIPAGMYEWIDTGDLDEIEMYPDAIFRKPHYCIKTNSLLEYLENHKYLEV